jgi:hypothetical protein
MRNICFLIYGLLISAFARGIEIDPIFKTSYLIDHTHTQSIQTIENQKFTPYLRIPVALGH